MYNIIIVSNMIITNNNLQVFVLNFRGLSFYFPIDSKFQPGYAPGLGSLHFPNDTSPLVAKTAIYVGNMPAGGSGEEHGSKTPPPPLPLVIMPLDFGYLFVIL